MTLEQIGYFFENRISYKPGYKFTFRHAVWCPFVHICLISTPVPDALGVNPPAPIVSTKQLGKQFLPRSEAECLAVAASIIRTLELHEMDEWFKIDGAHVKDPHPEKMTLLSFREAS